MVIIVMGPSGAGKSTIGRALAADLGWLFIDGDDRLAPSQTRDRVAPTDAQREEWLRDLHANVERTVGRREHMVLACSALKARHRDTLRADLNQIRFVYLKAPRPVLEERLARRSGSGGDGTPLHRQLMELEEPGDAAITADATEPPNVIVARLRQELGL